MKRLIGLVLVSSIMASCGGSNGPDGPDCGPFGSSRFDITGIEVSAVTYDELPSNIHNPVETTALDAANTITNGQLILELDADTTSASTLASTKNSSFSFSLISPAYACSPPPPYTDETIQSLNITSDSDFSADYPAGSNLNPLFTVEYRDWTTPLHTDANGNQTPYTLNEFVAANEKGARKIQLRMIAAPASGQSHIFNIDYQHTNGEQFSASTGVIRFE